MYPVINATFENGVLKPDEALNLPAGARLRLYVEVVDSTSNSAPTDWDELDQVCDEFPIDSGGARLTRDQLHERR
jgi:predicted DNA-binding antitoxin AbrB/MazE fold protein